MSPETVATLQMVATYLFTAATPLAVYYLHQIYKALAKAGKFEENATTLKVLEQLATFGINFAQEQTDKLLKGLIREGPRTGRRKEGGGDHACAASRPGGDKFTDKQAEIAASGSGELAQHAPPPSQSRVSFSDLVQRSGGTVLSGDRR